MTKQFKLKPKADNDLEKIYLYSLKGWGQNRAEKYIIDAAQSFQSLADNPALGYDASYLKPKLKAFLVVSHIVFLQ